MNTATLLARGVVHHARLHLATLGGAAVGCGVLIGALAVGDSVRASLERAAGLRLGAIESVLGTGERFFAADGLPARLATALPDARLAAVVELAGVAATPDGAHRADAVRVLGVDAAFWTLGPDAGRAGSSAAIAPGEAWLSPELARRLSVREGAELVVRVPRPSALTRDSALASAEDAVQAVRVHVAGVRAPEAFGAFAPVAGAGPAIDLFVDRTWLAEALGEPGEANRIYAARAAPAALTAALATRWEEGDLGLSWKPVADSVELASDQVFLPDTVTQALETAAFPVEGILTYFVNALEHDGRSTPYSTVGALGPLSGAAGAGRGPALSARGIAVNTWLANDLGLSKGDAVDLRYFVLGAGRALEERSERFTVEEILPDEGLGADETLAPEFPGMSEQGSCRDWEPGLPVDLDRIRDQDEAWWDAHRDAPKALVALATARELWANRFGSLTAARVPAGALDAARAALRAHVDPATLGLAAFPLAAPVEATSDFGGLFLGLSMFLIASALLLTALFFAFSVERRASELGLLRVLGFAPRAVFGLFLGEALLFLVPAAALGTGLGLGYAERLIAGLERDWSGAVGRTELVFAVRPASLVIGALGSTLLALGTVALVLRRQLRREPLALLSGAMPEELPGARRAARWPLGLGLVLATGAVLAARGAHGETRAGLAFGAGAGLFWAGFAALRIALHGGLRVRSLASLGWSGAARRPGRSLSTAALMASAVFLLVVAGANRQGPTPPDAPPSSGTGGFAFLGRTSLPVLHDLETPEGREHYGLDEADLAGVRVFGAAVRAGDEASCLNLDRPRRPRILGVPPARLSGRFSFAATLEERADPWSLLSDDLGPGVVPAIVDATSLQWTLHRALGDELELVDGRGRPLRARVVATLADSILQGDVVIARDAFARHFPDDAGARALLVDVDRARADALAQRLSRALSDVGLVLEPAAERLDLLHGVQNTYLSIFQALGGLGLVLGSVGLLALVLRHGVERRAELALLRVAGFERRWLVALFLGENGGLSWAGLALGVLAGGGVLAAQGGAASGALLHALVLVLVVGVLGLLWVWLGARLALRGEPFELLQRE